MPAAARSSPELPDPSSMPEFRYTFGDSLPTLYAYLASSPLVGVYTRFAPEGSRIFRFVCNASDKREVLLPSPRYARALRTRLATGPEPFVLVPVLLIKRGKCKNASGGRHMNVLLYNRVTHELERIDVKKYHLRGFNPKMLIRKLDEQAMDLFRAADPAARRVPELQVPLGMVRRLGESSPRRVFPGFLLRYLELRLKHPAKTSPQIYDLMKRASPTALAGALSRAFEAYAAFAEGVPARNPCKVGHVFNPETKRCRFVTARALQKRLVDPPPKPCPAGKVFDQLTRRCVAPERLARVDIMWDEASGANITKKKSFTHVGPLTAGLMNFLMRKHRHARFVVGSGKRPNAYRMLWKPSKKTLVVPRGYWDDFRAGMRDPSVHVLVTMISLTGMPREDGTVGSGHANALVYDKATNEMERFDPLGRYLMDRYEPGGLDRAIKAELAQHRDVFPAPVKYFGPDDYCPRTRVFQHIEGLNAKGVDDGGNCAIWRAWYIDVRLANPHLDRKRLVALATRRLEDVGSLHNFIKSYQQYLTDAIKAQERKKKKKRG